MRSWLWGIFLFPCLASASLRLVVLDVGEGQAVLLEREKRGILIDTGHGGKALHVLERLKAHGIEQLDGILLTHLHPDHASGYFRLREAFPKAPVMDNGHPLPLHGIPDMARWVGDALARDPSRRILRAGDVLRWQDVVIEVLWPKGPEGSDLNRHSLVLWIAYGASSVLLMGDADAFVERRLVERGGLGPVTVLVAGHHGAGDTGDRRFLKAVRPKVTVISVDRDNIRGYPSPETVERLREVSQRLLRTDEDGEVCMDLHRDGGLSPCL